MELGTDNIRAETTFGDELAALSALADLKRLAAREPNDSELIERAEEVLKLYEVAVAARAEWHAIRKAAEATLPDGVKFGSPAWSAHPGLRR